MLVNSVGIEDVEDLIKDLKQALDKVNDLVWDNRIAASTLYLFWYT